MSLSVHVQNNIADFVRDCVRKMLPNGGSIFDPTCGKENRQFKKYFTGGYEYDNNYLYKGTDKMYGFDVFKNSSLEANYDLVWYDPPFTPSPTKDRRAGDYGTQGLTDMDILKSYFSIPVIENLMTFSKKFLAIRGMDFFYPMSSFNFYSFYDMCMKNILEQKKYNLWALYIMPYTRHDMDEIIKNAKRPRINYSYTAVFQKGDYL